MSEAYAAPPVPSFRLIPSRFPPIGLFDTVATAADLAAVMELAGWTNDRLVAERLARLPAAEWVFGRPNASVVMAAFLHVAPGGMRFNGPDLGAWYAAAGLTTAVVEVGHHLRREARATGAARLSRQVRTYSARLTGDYLDIRGQQQA
ncbi:RES family NAD+ phosphorylase, partial [Phenylobacterium sp.]|uniref:RES family NAD+ phosphorylase n=1 Tax=Phenylobacterium sp. TaxID=1871053 RepID=UPI00286D2ED1